MLTLRGKINHGEKPLSFPFCITHLIISYDTITVLLCDGLLMHLHPLPDSECLESRDGMYSCISGTEEWSWNIVKVKVLVAQTCQILCDPMDCSPQGSSVHGILQARILEGILLKGIFPTQGLHCRQILYRLSYCGQGWLQLEESVARDFFERTGCSKAFLLPSGLSWVVPENNHWLLLLC